jgi:3D (Asp-Asp-Asp) domain-containing protein
LKIQRPFFKIASISWSVLVWHACKNQIQVGPSTDVESRRNADQLSPAAPKAPSQSQAPAARISNSSPNQSAPSGEPVGFSDFAFSAPSNIQKTLKLWGTYYYVPQVQSSAQGEEELLDGNNSNLLEGDRVSRKEWCALALQGSGLIKQSNGKSVVINFLDRNANKTVDCTGHIGKPDVVQQVRKNRFVVVNSVYGKGSCVQQLIPFRTLAVDSKVIPCGSLVYIPQAVGKKIAWPDGRSLTHDGYFIAGDAGAAIKGTHVDFFVGTVFKVPFDFVTSSASGTFEAQIVSNSTALAKLKEMSN